MQDKLPLSLSKTNRRYTSLSYLKLAIILFISLLSWQVGYAQEKQVYPKVTGYFSITNSFGTLTKDGFTGNFGKVYTVSFPFGINLLKSDKFGISFEISPAIRTENNIAKVSSITFQPGAMFRYPHGFNFIGRVAFESNGRFGVSPVFNKVVVRGKDANFFASLSFPVRFGNALPASVGSGLQLGVSF